MQNMRIDDLKAADKLDVVQKHQEKEKIEMELQTKLGVKKRIYINKCFRSA
jgi:hypothetical protein